MSQSVDKIEQGIGVRFEGVDNVAEGAALTEGASGDFNVSMNL